MSTPTRGPEAQAFTYHRNGLLALVWTVVILAPVELLVTHLILRQWSEAAAIALTAVSALSVAFLVVIAISLRFLPVLVDAAGVRVRLGLMLDQRFDWDVVAAAEPAAGLAMRDPRVLRATTLTPANVRLTLNQPVRARRGLKPAQDVTAVDLYLDAPAAFLAAFAARRPSCP